jgi:hypothetical protein
MLVKALKARFLRYFWIMRDAAKYLLNMKRLPVVIMMIIAGIFLAFQTLGTGTKNPPGKYEEIIRLVGEMLTQAHFSPQRINDDFSQKIFNKYLTDLDPEKNMFLQSDIASLQKKYGNAIDEEIKGAPVEFFLQQVRLLIHGWKKLPFCVRKSFQSHLILLLTKRWCSTVTNLPMPHQMLR